MAQQVGQFVSVSSELSRPLLSRQRSNRLSVEPSVLMSDFHRVVQVESPISAKNPKGWIYRMRMPGSAFLLKCHGPICRTRILLNAGSAPSRGMKISPPFQSCREAGVWSVVQPITVDDLADNLK